MTIGKKIVAGYALALVVLVVLGGLAYWSTSRLIENNRQVEHTHKVLNGLETLLSLLKDAETGQRGFLLTAREEYLQPYKEARAKLDQQVAALQAAVADNEWQSHALDGLRPLIVQKEGELEKTIQLRGKDEEGFKRALKLVEGGEGKDLMEQIRTGVERMKEEERRLLVQRSAGAEASARVTNSTITVGIPLAILLVSLGGFFTARAVTQPVREVLGRLTSTGAELLASTSQHAAGAQEQAAAVAQTVTTVDEVAQTAEHAAQRARGVGEAVQRNLEIGKAGRRAIEDSIAAKRRVQEQVESTAENILSLAEQAQAIGDIIATVNDLAEQTNLLSLNAAIEASRAGEHGKGFAVVAGEVKTLADQSKKATVQVRQILGEIQKATNKAVLSTEEVTRGVAGAIQLGTQAGETINSLAQALAETAQAAAQIVASAGQQATGMAQIRQAIKNIDQVVQQNLAATRQTELAAKDLNQLGTQLAGLVTT
jgi:methyl-accepting chemotaxis protein